MKLSNSFIAVKKITSSVPISTFSEDDLNCAAESILKAEGVINPLVLRRTSPQSYDVVDGHFEYYAAAKAKEMDSKKGEYIGAFVIELENEEILQQQVELLRKRESGDKEMKKKLEDLTAKVAQLTKSVKEIQEDLSKLKNPEPGKGKKPVEEKLEKKVLTNEHKPESNNELKTPQNKSEKLDYDNMTVTELKAMAKKQKIVGYSKMNKGQLNAALTSDKKG